MDLDLYIDPGRQKYLDYPDHMDLDLYGPRKQNDLIDYPD